MEDPERRRNLLGTFEELLDWGVLPVVNENDSVGVEEIENARRGFGDNDTLSARVAALVGADLLVLLPDIDARYDADPRANPDARPIRLVREVTPELRRNAGGAGARGTGGMHTKLDAGALCLQSGITMVIAHGGDPAVLYDILDGKDVGTRFAG
jgi:glutamate 5-kinase